MMQSNNQDAKVHSNFSLVQFDFCSKLRLIQTHSLQVYENFEKRQQMKYFGIKNFNIKSYRLFDLHQKTSMLTIFNAH